MLYIMIPLLVFTVGFLYKRYVPVRGVPCSVLPDLESTKIVDVRDYNLSYNDPIIRAINIPVAYMKRHFKEIPNVNIHVVASDHLEKNMSIRFFRKKGFTVIGYTLTDCKCNQDIKEITI
ncbi:hypothetical protein [Peribacillus acanthi]|uniref:hypothetical protein n=1 Tax=Peribacillus acanthi TaxID=2171554 RepID=UPI000D3E9B93|nr:hypothetical protein [Peribacillus acanthi]